MTNTLPAATPRQREPELARVDGSTRPTVQVVFGVALAAVPLKQIFTDAGWLLQVWLGMAIVVGPAAALRRHRLPAAWHLLPGLIGLVLFATASFAPEHAIAGLVPEPSSWQDVSSLATQLRSTMNEQAAPLHTTAAIRLFLVFGLGLLAAIADLVAVGLRRPALIGMPILLLSVLSGAVPRQDVSWWLTAIAAVGFLLVLASNTGANLASWGPQVRLDVPGGRSGAPPSARSGGTGRRIGFVAIVAALAISAILPIPSAGLLSHVLHHGHLGVGDGTGMRVVLDPLATLRGSLTRGAPVNLYAVNVRGTTSAEPFYLRESVLDTYTGSAWVPGSTETTVHLPGPGTFPSSPPVEPASTASSTFSATITVQQAGGTPPLFQFPTSITGLRKGAQWTTGSLLLTGAEVSQGQHYDEQVVQPQPSDAQLRAAATATPQGLQRYLQLPAIPAEVGTLVTSLTEGSASSYDRARAIFDYFTDPAHGFTYALNTQHGDSGSDLVDFLRNRTGFCQQYAAAMGVMLRQAGVPARVVLGYTHPAADANGTFEVTTNDAHAWVEAYFSGIGWIPFDPTPLAGADAGRAVALGWAPHPGDAPAQNGTAPTASNAPVAPGPSRSSGSQHPSTVPATPAAQQPASDSRWETVAEITAIVILGFALTPAFLRWSRRRRHLSSARRGTVEALWDELADTCRDLGIGWSEARSPRQVAAWLAELGIGRDAVAKLAQAVELSRYGGSSDGSGTTGSGAARGVEVGNVDLIRALRQIRGELFGTVSHAERLRARVLPLSLLGLPVAGRVRVPAADTAI